MCYDMRVMASDKIDPAPAAQGISDADFAEAVASPSSFSVDGLSQSNRPIADLIAADKYLRMRSRKARHPLAGLVSHLIPPGPCDR